MMDPNVLNNYEFIGVDEVGTGAIAGPIVIAAVYLDSEQPILGIDDSKRLSKQTRILLDEEIYHKAQWTHVVMVSVDEIKTQGFGGAYLSGYRECLSTAHKKFPDIPILVDGSGVYEWICKYYSQPAKIKLGHDHLDAPIAAASIIAKVYREKRMQEYGRLYPEYGFERHNGYGTPEHKKQIKIHGFCPIHLRSSDHQPLMFFHNPEHLFGFLSISSNQIGIYSELERQIEYLVQIGILIDYQPSKDLWIIDKDQLSEVIRSSFKIGKFLSQTKKDDLLLSIPDSIPTDFSGKKIRQKVQELKQKRYE